MIDNYLWPLLSDETIVCVCTKLHAKDNMHVWIVRYYNSWVPLSNFSIFIKIDCKTFYNINSGWCLGDKPSINDVLLKELLLTDCKVYSCRICYYIKLCINLLLFLYETYDLMAFRTIRMIFQYEPGYVIDVNKIICLDQKWCKLGFMTASCNWRLSVGLLELFVFICTLFIDLIYFSPCWKVWFQ